MTDTSLKRWLSIAAALQAIITGLVGATLWIYAQGRANADVVRKDDLARVEAVQKSELESIHKDVTAIREDVAYIRGRLDKARFDNILNTRK